MDKLKLAQLGERLKTGGAQMGRMVTGKVKEILQTPTPESRMVDEATLETMEEPNWGTNLRICKMINGEELSGTEIVRAIKKKIAGGGKSAERSQKLSLDLLEACAMNCEKVFSEVASEKVLDEMMKMIDNPLTVTGNRKRAMDLIRAWGESEDLAYLPVFRQTYMSLKGRGIPPPLVQEGNSPPMEYSLESYVHQQPLSPPGTYPIPDTGMHDTDGTAFPLNYRNLSVEEKKEYLVITRNSLELLSSILDAETEPKPLKEDLTMNMLERCKQSQPAVKGIIESTTDDEGMLFEALYLHDELQQVISKYEQLEVTQKSGGQQPENSDPIKYEQLEATQKSGGELPETSDASKCEELEAAKKLGENLPLPENAPEAKSPTLSENNLVDSPKGDDAESSHEKKKGD
ncbi:TOM1-like protein 2 [Alnus glutinosa]|uniref:TOM1-like protein 2 n=1 Tax=Alnus glutinosa TaxID=3517 RepID=UPI002D79FED0|nr:TOM1-like protein 2 [Alnus glutinosa]XP_062148382.1 TOM1-like protein 2 [Alnus glutinosa]